MAAKAAPATTARGGEVTNTKVVLLGDSAVGKSSLALRFARNEFHANQETTIGAAFLSRTIQVTAPATAAAATTTSTPAPSASPTAAHHTPASSSSSSSTTRALKLEIWDTAGQERYRSLAPIYYRGACGALVVYDITNRDSFDKAQSWLHELRANAERSLVVVLVGNKSDLDAARQVTFAEAQAMATAEKVAAVYETSAKDGHNVEAVFATLGSKMVECGDVKSGGNKSAAAGGGGVRMTTAARSAQAVAGGGEGGGAAATARSMCCA